MKVLLSAFYCLPNGGSDSAVGWNWAREIAARGHQVFVITRAINRNAIEAALSKDPIPNLHFLFHDLSPTVRFWAHKPFVSYFYYLLWQFTAARVTLEAHSNEHFDLVQHVTMASFRLPTFMWKLGIPLVFGPVGGGEDTPRTLRRGLGWRGRLWDWPRRFSNLLVPWDPLMKATFSLRRRSSSPRMRLFESYRQSTVQKPGFSRRLASTQKVFNCPITIAQAPALPF